MKVVHFNKKVYLCGMKKHIPNMITSCNLLCGAVATYMATQHAYDGAFLLIIVAAILDFFDGFTARLLHVSSPIGKELDSLADNITFGLAPTMMLFCHLQDKHGIGCWAFVVFLMAAFSGLRLAKFNVDERQTSSFIGLATPANALFWASLVCSIEFFVRPNTTIGYVLIALSLLSCYLLVAEIPMFSLKFKNATWTSNKVQFVFLIGATLLLVLFAVGAILLGWQVILQAGYVIMVWYILLSILSNLCSKK